MYPSGFQSSAFWLSLAGLAVTAYLANTSGSLAASLIVFSYNLTNAWIKK